MRKNGTKIGIFRGKKSGKNADFWAKLGDLGVEVFVGRSLIPNFGFFLGISADGVSIPQSYTSFLAPVSSSKLYNEVRGCREHDRHPEVPNLGQKMGILGKKFKMWGGKVKNVGREIKKMGVWGKKRAGNGTIWRKSGKIRGEKEKKMGEIWGKIGFLTGGFFLEFWGENFGGFCWKFGNFLGFSGAV